MCKITEELAGKEENIWGMIGRPVVMPGLWEVTLIPHILNSLKLHVGVASKSKQGHSGSIWRNEARQRTPINLGILACNVIRLKCIYAQMSIRVFAPLSYPHVVIFNLDQ